MGEYDIKNSCELAIDFFEGLNRTCFPESEDSKYLKFLTLWKNKPSEQLKEKLINHLRSNKSLEMLLTCISYHLYSEMKEERKNENEGGEKK